MSSAPSVRQQAPPQYAHVLSPIQPAFHAWSSVTVHARLTSRLWSLTSGPTSTGVRRNEACKLVAVSTTNASDPMNQARDHP